MDKNWFHLIRPLTAAALLLAQGCLMPPGAPAAESNGAAGPSSRFKPWRPVRIYRIDKVTVTPIIKPGAAAGKDASAGAGPWESIFARATVFETDKGARVVPASGHQNGGFDLDYLDVRSDGGGFGVPSDKYTAKAHLGLSKFRINRGPKPTVGQPLTIDTEVEAFYTASGAKEEAARLRMEATLVEQRADAPAPTDAADPPAVPAKLPAVAGAPAAKRVVAVPTVADNRPTTSSRKASKTGGRSRR